MTRRHRIWAAALISLCFALVPVASASADTVLADTGFRPDPNGFQFENYGNESSPQNLGPAEMRKLFGDPVCAEIAGDTCTLTPEAQRYMDEQNKGMADGHCYGFAALSELLYKGQYAAFGPGPSFSYTLQGNEAIQRAIAYAFVFQSLDAPLAKGLPPGTPVNQILTALKASLNQQNPETFVLGIYKFDGTGGHAIVPYAVVDHGGGSVGVKVYDNNAPGDANREVTFDTNNDSWTYNGSPNPSTPPEIYRGDPTHPGLDLTPNTPALAVQPCPFCKPGASPTVRPGDAPVPPPPANPEDQVTLDGNAANHAHLLIHTSDGKALGFFGPNPIETVVGGKALPRFVGGPNDFNEALEPMYKLPDRPATIAVDGSQMRGVDTESVSSIGPGHDVGVDNLVIGRGQRDILRFVGGIEQMSFTSAARQKGSPLLRIGADSSGADSALTLKLVNMPSRSTVFVRVNQRRSTITFFSHSRAATNYVLSTVRETKTRRTTLASERVHLARGQAAVFSYATDHRSKGASGGGAG